MNWYKKALQMDHPIDFDAQGNFYNDRFSVPSPENKRELNFPKEDIDNQTELTEKGLNAILDDIYAGDLDKIVDGLLSKWSERILYTVHNTIQKEMAKKPIDNEEGFAYGVANALADQIGDQEGIEDENVRASMFHQIYNFTLTQISQLDD